jgi:hypothetical protein
VVAAKYQHISQDGSLDFDPAEDGESILAPGDVLGNLCAFNSVVFGHSHAIQASLDGSFDEFLGADD